MHLDFEITDATDSRVQAVELRAARVGFPTQADGQVHLDRAGQLFGFYVDAAQRSRWCPSTPAVQATASTRRASAVLERPTCSRQDR